MLPSKGVSRQHALLIHEAGVFAVVFAAVLLGQIPSTGQVLGGVLVLAGIVVVQGGAGGTAARLGGDVRAVLPGARPPDARFDAHRRRRTRRG